MLINRKTRNIHKYLTHLNLGEQFRLGIAIDSHVEQRLKALGFQQPILPGQRLLAPADCGPASRRNAEGFEIVHRDQPMETKYRQREWCWTQFTGRDTTEEVCKIVEVPYKRYPRTHVAPYSVELEIKERSDGKRFVVAGPFTNAPSKAELVIATNTANMMRETLDGFEVLNGELSDWTQAPVHRLNWQLLPPGENPWKSAKPAVDAILKRVPVGNQSVLRTRFAAIGRKSPDFVAVGIGGFEGYVVFGFKSRGLCVLECSKVNNATYVLPMQSWEIISQMTKAKILNNKAHTARLIHNLSWFDSLDRWIGGAAGQGNPTVLKNTPISDSQHTQSNDRIN